MFLARLSFAKHVDTDPFAVITGMGVHGVLDTDTLKFTSAPGRSGVRGEMAVATPRRPAARQVYGISDAVLSFCHTVHEEGGRGCVIRAPGWEARRASLGPCKLRHV